MQVTWYEQGLNDVRTELDWLSDWERRYVATLKVAKRRFDWLLGRWTAKRAVADYCNLASQPADLRLIEIRPDGNGAPHAMVRGVAANITISLSHRNGLAACALGHPVGSLGCDLEAVEPRSAEFVEDYFTAGEQILIDQAPAADRFAVIALLWSAKESALKALGVGLRCSTKSLSVEYVSTSQPSSFSFCIKDASPLIPPSQSWRALLVTSSEGVVFDGKWCRAGEVVRTMVIKNLDGR